MKFVVSACRAVVRGWERLALADGLGEGVAEPLVVGLGETKTRASDVTLPLVCVAALQQRQARQAQARAAAGPAWTRFDLVFTARYGDPIEPRNVNRYFAARCDVASVRQITVPDAPARRCSLTWTYIRGS
ncbi:MAG: hypothetical protein ACRDRU_23245 [Pseudonocardiaceae bacterium]